MKRTFTSIIMVLLLTASVCGCTIDNTYERSGSRTETSDPEQLLSDDKDVNAGSISLELENYTPAVHGMLIPYTGAFEEDEFMPEKNRYLFGLADLEGNKIFEPVFDSVIECDGYYILNASIDGENRSGILSYDGSLFTGLKFDSVGQAKGNSGEVCFYCSEYSDGNIIVTSLNSELEAIDKNTIAIDYEAMSLDPETSRLTVNLLSSGSAYLFNSEEFYSTFFLIDTDNGTVLYKSGTRSADNGRLFGNMIIEQDPHGRGIKVFDLDGNTVFSDENAYSGRICDNCYMIADGGKLSIYDTEWHVAGSMEVDPAAIVMTSFERIAVCSSGKTSLYDKDLNLINESDLDLRNGTYFRDWYDYGEGDMYFDSISGTEEIYNLNTGARLSKEFDFYYSFDCGYITADNKSDGNDPVNKWRIYSKDFDLLKKGEGQAYLFSDEITGDIYLEVIDGDVMTVYSVADDKELFSYGDVSYDLKAADGKFYGWNRDHWFMLDGSGNELLVVDVAHEI